MNKAIKTILSMTILIGFAAQVQASAPTISFEPSAPNVTATTALIGGAVNPNGEDTTVRFAVGIDPPPFMGSWIDADQNPLTGTFPQAASTTLTDLTPGVTYKFKLEATNPSGSISSETLFGLTPFTTESAAP